MPLTPYFKAFFSAGTPKNGNSQQVPGLLILVSLLISFYIYPRQPTRKMSSSNTLTPRISLVADAFRIGSSAKEAGAEWAGRTTANQLQVRDPFPQFPEALHCPHQSRVVPGLAALPLTGRGRQRALLSHL